MTLNLREIARKRHQEMVERTQILQKAEQETNQQMREKQKQETQVKMSSVLGKTFELSETQSTNLAYDDSRNFSYYQEPCINIDQLSFRLAKEKLHLFAIRTGERHPEWIQVDSLRHLGELLENVTPANPQDYLLVINPRNSKAEYLNAANTEQYFQECQ